MVLGTINYNGVQAGLSKKQGRGLEESRAIDTGGRATVAVGTAVSPTTPTAYGADDLRRQPILQEVRPVQGDDEVRRETRTRRRPDFPRSLAVLIENYWIADEIYPYID